MFGIDSDDNELASLELIHLFVETLDKYFFYFYTKIK